MKRLLPSLSLLLAALPSFAQSSVDDRGNGGSRWGASYFPNHELVTHDGKRVRFFDDLVKNKVVVINFIYTSCPDSCPMETARLREVKDILGDRVGRDVFIYSITIDPEVDTPEVLKAYTERFETGPGWLFLTGKEKDITELRKKLGLYIAEIQAEDSNDHNLSVIIGNQATGRWMKRSPFENPYVLAEQVGSWLHNWKLPSPDDLDYEDAPELRNISKGESMFRTRCSACHVIGVGDGVARVGPNLIGVTQKRTNDWLHRWLAAPDEMVAQEDPIAMELFERYNRVQMPNLRLNEYERTILLEYVDEESLRAQEELGIDPEDYEETETAKCCLKANEDVEDAGDAAPGDDELVDLLVEEDAVDATPSALDSILSELSGLSLASIGAGLLLGVVTLFRLKSHFT